MRAGIWMIFRRRRPWIVIPPELKDRSGAGGSARSWAFARNSSGHGGEVSWPIVLALGSEEPVMSFPKRRPASIDPFPGCRSFGDYPTNRRSVDDELALRGPDGLHGRGGVAAGERGDVAVRVVQVGSRAGAGNGSRPGASP